MSLTGEAMLELEQGNVVVGAILVAILLGGGLLAFRIARDLEREL